MNFQHQNPTTPDNDPNHLSGNPTPPGAAQPPIYGAPGNYNTPPYYNMYNMPYNMYYPPVMPREYYEKKAVAKTGNRVGGALLMFYAISTVLSIALSLLLITTDVGSIVRRAFSDRSVLLMLENTVLTVAGFGGAALLLIKWEHRRVQEVISFAPPKKNLVLPFVMAGMGVCYTANVMVSLLQSALSPIFDLKMSDFGMPQGVFGFLISVVTTACVPALIEEFIFRGAVMGVLQKFGKPFAIFTSAVLFGLIHGNLIQIPFAFIIGLVLGFAVMETGSIWTGVLIHFSNNFLSVVLQYTSSALNEQVYSILSMLVILVLITLGIFGFYLLSAQNKNLLRFEKTVHESSTNQRFWWLMGQPTVIIFLVLTGFSILLSQVAGL